MSSEPYTSGLPAICTSYHGRLVVVAAVEHTGSTEAPSGVTMVSDGIEPASSEPECDPRTIELRESKRGFWAVFPGSTPPIVPHLAVAERGGARRLADASRRPTFAPALGHCTRLSGSGKEGSLQR